MPFPKNPILAKFFIQLGWVEELGPGVLNINRYLKAYAGKGQPELIEGPVFKVRIPLPEYGKAVKATDQAEEVEALDTILILLNEGLKDSGDGVKKADDTVTDTEGISREVKVETAKVVVLISTDEGINMKGIVARSKKSRASVARYLRVARAAQLIEFIGPPKTGGYYLTEHVKGRL